MSCMTGNRVLKSTGSYFNPDFWFKMCPLKFLLLMLLSVLRNASARKNDFDLPAEHLPCYFNSFPKLAADHKLSFDHECCWGYEDSCPKRYSNASCQFDSKSGWAKNIQQQMKIFDEQADFGYIKDRVKSLRKYCKPMKQFKLKSSLVCSKNLEFCRGRNLFIDFKNVPVKLQSSRVIRYDMDVLAPGDIGGSCALDRSGFEAQQDRLSPLQSWTPEMRFFRAVNTSEPFKCDLSFNTTFYVMKIDATANMYHHFCDFVNLYATQHLNSVNNSRTFSKRNRILLWESLPYRSSFGVVWKAFSDFDVLNLNDFSGKKVCFRNVVFPLLPRMVFGLYYNTPIIPNCEKSGLFNAFSEFILHRLHIRKIADKQIRVLFLSRKTKFRRVLNEDDLLQNLQKRRPFLNVKKVEFDWSVSFVDQLIQVSNADILIGMHGAGLTHLLFLPKWAVVFELYNCNDKDCYKDLSRLRGLRYLTWINRDSVHKQDAGRHPDDGSPHEKFTNYRFEFNDFLQLVDQAIEHVNSSKPKVKPIHDEL